MKKAYPDTEDVNRCETVGHFASRLDGYYEWVVYQFISYVDPGFRSEICQTALVHGYELISIPNVDILYFKRKPKY